MELEEIKNGMEKDEVSFDEFYTRLRNEDIGDWDNVNSEDIIKQYVTEKSKEGIHVSHILQALEENPSRHEQYHIWLGNSMITPTPINNKKDLVEALGIDLDEVKTPEQKADEIMNDFNGHLEEMREALEQYFRKEEKKDYETLEREFVEIAQEMLDRFGTNQADLKDIIDDQTTKHVEEVSK